MSRVKINGEVVVPWQFGEGNYEWVGMEYGIYEVTHESLMYDELLDTQMAAFVVTQEEIGTLAEGAKSVYDVVVVYDGEAHGVEVSTEEMGMMEEFSPTVSYAMRKSGPWQSVPLTFTNVCEKSLWYKLSFQNGLDYIHEAKLSIQPKLLTSEMVQGTGKWNIEGDAVMLNVEVCDSFPCILRTDDYSIEYEANEEEGTTQLTVTGKGNYTGTVTKTFPRVATNEVFEMEKNRRGGFWWKTGGDAPWNMQLEEGIDGSAAMRSEPMGDDAVSWIESTFVGNGTLSFQWRTSCERNDSLQLLVDGVVVSRLTGEQPWKTYEMELLGALEHTVRWQYVKGRSGAGGRDCAWLDDVKWTPMPLEEALDTAEVVWQEGGEDGWFCQDETTYDGICAAQSGRITHNESSRMETTVVGPGSVTFTWKASCEDGYDWVDFLMDETIVYSLTGITGWQTLTAQIPEGQHTLAWVYSKDELDEEEETATERVLIETTDGRRVQGYFDANGNVAFENGVRASSQNTIPLLVGGKRVKKAEVFYEDSMQDCAWVDCVKIETRAVSKPEEVAPGVVPYAWLEATLGVTISDAATYEAVVNDDPDGDGMATWEEYVAGSDPTDPNSVFRVMIHFENDEPVITWAPDLGGTRRYCVEGRESLEPEDAWEPVDYDRHHFFRAKVEMGEE